MATEQASAGQGANAQIMRENLFESLPPLEQERFLESLEDALEEGLGKDAAWDRAWHTIQAGLASNDSEETDFALEDEAEDE
ncbi:MAG: hypothetical protein ACYDDF_12190 [Thermoplasmatota archaeon]